ncbi:MAG: general secretion pathway protein GspB [Pseudomonadota bacterium]
MSLILDALRKSDVEHARQKAPGVATTTVHSAPPQRSALWLIVLIALLLNAAFLAWLVWGRDSGDAPASAPAPAAVVDNTSLVDIAAAPPEPVIPSTKANVRSLLDETIREAAATRELQPANVQAEPASVPVPATNTPTVLTEPDDPNLSLPTLDELRATRRTSLPDLSIALHVYNADPASRFAFIAGRKVTEGSQLDNGARIVEITPYGVILTHNGERLLLPRE